MVAGGDRDWCATVTSSIVSGYDRGSSAPIEQIVDPDGQSLNFGVARSERVNQEARRHRRVFQPNKLVVNSGRPVGSKRPFDARASHPATDGSRFAEGCERRVDGRTGLDPASASFGVKQPMVKARPGKPVRPARVETQSGCSDAVTKPTRGMTTPMPVLLLFAIPSKNPSAPITKKGLT